MLFKPTKLKGAFIIEPEFKKDKRGFFARSFCQKEFERHGLKFNIVQSNISYNKKKGTIRGMHYQITPYEEKKLISFPKGAIYDVIIDLRPRSSTYCQWFGLELNAKNHKMLYIPKGFAHGFQTIEDNCIIYYQMSQYYQPKAARGVRWNDPVFKIKWPIKNIIISEKDKGYQFMEKQK